MGPWQRLEQQLNERFLERRAEVRGILISLVARQHVLLIGPPGTAKSLLAKTACEAVGGRFFRVTLTPTATPDELLGPVSVKRLVEDGVYERNLSCTLAEADVAAVDEIWKSNAATLNCLLSVLNEREVPNGGRPVRIPLRTLVGTSNELPQEEGLEALWDRFGLRFQVRELREARHFLAMLQMNRASAEIRGPSLDEVDAAYRFMRQMPWNGVEDLLVHLWDAAARWHVSVSARRWELCLDLCRANALLEGRTEVTADDLPLLADALWQEPGQRATIRQGILAIVHPALAEAEELYDAAEEQHRLACDALRAWDSPEANAQEITSRVSEAAGKLRKAAARLGELVEIARGQGRTPQGIEALLQRVRAFDGEVRTTLTEKRLGPASSLSV